MMRDLLNLNAINDQVLKPSDLSDDRKMQPLLC